MYDHAFYMDNGQSIAAGAFSKTYSYTPSVAGSVRVCAYVGESSISTPLATATQDFTVAADPNAPPAPPCPVAPTSPVGLVASVDAARRPSLSWEHRPSLSWEAGGSRTDVVHIEKDDDSRDSIEITGDGMRVWSDPDGERDPELGKVTSSGGRMTATLTRGLSPGNYVWQVVRTTPSLTGLWLCPDVDKAVSVSTGTFAVLGPPLTELTVKAVGVRGSTYSYPGRTEFRITTASFARIKVTLRRGRSHRSMTMDWGSRVSGTVPIRWECPSVGPRRVSYSVRARDGFGATMKRSGSYIVVGQGTCTAMRRTEAAARARADAASAAAARRAAAAAAAAHQAGIDRYKRNCSALGGAAVLLNMGTGYSWFCRGPYGGTMYVPW